jgi:hypothetical protein
VKKLLLGAVTVASCLALLAAGCDSGNGTGFTSPPPPTDGGGGPQIATKLAFGLQPSNTAAGHEITPAVQVAVQDAQGNTVTGASPDITVAIGTSPGSGVLLGTSTVGAVNGVATFSNLSIEVVEGYTLTASAEGLSGATSAAFTVTPAAATRLVFGVQPGDTAPGEQIPAVMVLVQDPYGNTVWGPGPSITVALGTNPGGGVLSGTSTQAASNGAATFSDLNIDKPGTGYTLTAAADGLTGSTSSPFSTNGAPVATVTVTPGQVEANDNFVGFTATTSDAAGNVLPGRVVTWTQSANMACLYPEASSMSLCGLANGSETITATSAGKSGTALLTVAAGSDWLEECYLCCVSGC